MLKFDSVHFTIIIIIASLLLLLRLFFTCVDARMPLYSYLFAAVIFLPINSLHTIQPSGINKRIAKIGCTKLFEKRIVNTKKKKKMMVNEASKRERRRDEENVLRFTKWTLTYFFCFLFVSWFVHSSARLTPKFFFWEIGGQYIRRGYALQSLTVDRVNSFDKVHWYTLESRTESRRILFRAKMNILVSAL